MNRTYSFIIPVYNRPDELSELLESISNLEYREFEVIIIEDGSSIRSEDVANRYKDNFPVVYLDLPRSGPAIARNAGMKASRGQYLLFVDSDCLVPPEYLTRIDNYLDENLLDVFGGPDKASEEFSPVQKAISYAMTSFLTTGGIRGGHKKIDRFYPRSFNMGISRRAYENIGGYPETRMHPGEDMVFSIELIKRGFTSGLIPCAHVFHKRRTSFLTFLKQVQGFGRTRYIISQVYPETFRIFFLFPSLFLMGTIGLAALSLLVNIWFFTPIIAWMALIFLDASLKNRNIGIGIQSVGASLIQLCGYGLGFFVSWFNHAVAGRDEFGVFSKGFYPDSNF